MNDSFPTRSLYPFQNETGISNRGGSLFGYVTRAIWKGIRSRFPFGMGINGQTAVFGIIGQPLDHSESPSMHGTAYLAHGLNAVYVPFPVTELSQIPDALAGIRALAIKGINVTVPYKEAVIPFLDHIDPVALQMGSVNTIVNRHGKLTGYNTDGDGFVLSLQEELGWSPKDRSVAIVGSGGSARGIAFALCRAGIRALYLHVRSLEKAGPLCHSIQKAYPHITIGMGYGPFTSVGSELVVQTTPVGMQGKDEGKLPVPDMDWVFPHHLIVDIVYRPSVTAFMAEAQSRGARILGGAGMLAGQGMLAYELFTGRKVDYHTLKQGLM